MHNTNNKNRPQLLSLPDYFFESLTELLLELGMDVHQFIDEFTNHYTMTAAKHYEQKSDIYKANGLSEFTVKKSLNDNDYKTAYKSHYQSLINRIKQLCEQSEDGCILVHGEKNSYMAAFNETNSATVVSAAASTLDKLVKAGVVEKVDNEKIRFISSLNTKELNSPDNIIVLLSNLVSQAPLTPFDNLSLEEIEEALFQMA